MKIRQLATEGMRALKYGGNLVKLWKDLDTDGSGELSLDEIDQGSADMWSVVC